LLGSRFLDPIDQLAFMVRLPKLDVEPMTLCGIVAELFHVLQCCAAVGLWFACAQEIEIGAVEDVDLVCHVQHVSLPQRARLILALIASSPTAPMSTSLPIT